MVRKTVVILGSVLVIAALLTGCWPNPKPPEPEPAQTAGENGQKTDGTAENALEQYFQIAIDFSKGEFESDAVFKKELKARYQKIMTGPLLEKFYQFVDEGNIQSDYYISTFMQEVNSRIKEITIPSRTAESIEAETTVNNNYEFSAMFDDFESPTFIRDNKVAGLNQEKFTELVRQYNPTGITSNQVEKYSFTLVREGQDWKFSRLDHRTEETRLLELQAWDGQKISL